MPLAVQLSVRRVPDDPAGFTIRVGVDSGQTPLRLLLYVDGSLAGACDSIADLYEFHAATDPERPHALTVRVIDAHGQWGAASAMLPGQEAPRHVAASAAPRVSLRASVCSRLTGVFD
jgi:hypothetical protein